MEYTPKLGSWIPDDQQPDPGDDWSFDDIVNSLIDRELPSDGVLDLRKFCSPIESQGQLGSCVGNATVSSLEFINIRLGRQHVELSRLFNYYNARLMHQAHDKDNGTYIRLAFGTLSSLGTCTETKWPYDTKKVFVRPTWGCYREAAPNKITSYYKISGTGEVRLAAIKQALRAQCPIVFGCTVNDTFINTGVSGVIALPDASPVRGSHAMMICGYNENNKTLIVRNSWGVTWGQGGYCYMKYEHLDLANASDFWVPVYY